MENLWWEKIPNAVRFAESIVSALTEGKNVALSLPEFVPWYDDFRERVQFVQRQELGGYGIDSIIDYEDEEPGKTIFTKYCKKELRDEYRPAIGYAKFLSGAESITLNSTVAWIKVESEDRIKEWCKFISDYSKELKKGTMKGLFVIETKGVLSGITLKGGKIIKYNEYIGEFDYYIFSTLSASVLDIDRNKKEYLAEIATSVLDNDVELSSYCLSLSTFNDFWNDPICTIRTIVSNACRSDGDEFSFDLSSEEIQQRVWKAQIKNLFPKIEAFRGEFVSKYSDDIKKELPISSSSGEQYTKPYEVEIGTLYYMVCNRKIDIDTEEYKKLKIFKEARNKLAHLEVLEINDIDKLICYM